MPYEKFLIAPADHGLQTDLQPWRIMDDAFASLNNAYVWRGRVRKRFGSEYMINSYADSRLNIPLLYGTALPGGAGVGITDGAGHAVGVVAGFPFSLPVGFLIIDANSTTFFTVTALGGPNVMAISSLTIQDPKPIPPGTCTFNTTTGAYVFNNAAANSQIFFFRQATTDGAGNLNRTVGANALALGQQIWVGTDIYTIITAGNALNNMLINGQATVAQANTVTGQILLTGAPATSGLSLVPALPVMGIPQYETGAINDHPTFAFDTKFAYQFISGTGWIELGNELWHGQDYQFFWSTNWVGLDDSTVLLFTTNFNVSIPAINVLTDDPIRFWDGVTWNNFTPQFLSDGSKVLTARIILPFKNRLILLNTIEQNAANATQNFKARCRYSQNGSPVQGNNPIYPASWLESTQANSQGAGFVDATTDEGIISAEFIKDRLIVYFERSTWELAYTGNEILPFVWQKINTELGSQSTESSVPFDTVVLTIGNTGVHACSGANVQRVDSVIPDQVFEIQSENNAENRVAGIRDYLTEMVYWTLPSSENNTLPPYPNRVLVYNYKTGSWAFNDDSITAFGYFEQQDDVTWQNNDNAWQDSNETWVSGVVQADFRRIVAGNQEGFIYRLNPDLSANEHVLQITNLTQTTPFVFTTTFVVINHTFAVGDYFHIGQPSSIAGTTDAAGSINVIVPPPHNVGMYFVINNDVYTVNNGGAGNQPLLVNNTNQTPGGGTFNIGTGQLILNNVPSNADVVIYPGPALANILGNTNADNIYQVFSVTDANTFIVNNFIPIGTYRGNLYISRVSNVNFLTKQWNFYNKEDSNISIPKIDFNVTKTTAGQITVDYYPSSTELSMIQEASATQAALGTSVLETSPYALVPLESVQERLWHPVYFQTLGETIQLYFYFSPQQITQQTIAFSDFELNALVVYAMRAGRMQ